MQKALLCDADGTLLDSEGWLKESFVRTARELGFYESVKDKLEELLTGKPLKDRYIELSPDGVGIEECIRAHVRHQAEIMEMIKPFWLVGETLALLDNKCVDLAIVTSRRTRAPLIDVLRKYDLEDFFRVIVCLEDVENAKPHPDGIFLAMEKLGVTDRGNVFMLGDAAVDIEAGKNAGVSTVGALYGFEGANLREAGADYYINNFPEIIQIVL